MKFNLMAPRCRTAFISKSLKLLAAIAVIPAGALARLRLNGLGTQDIFAFPHPPNLTRSEIMCLLKDRATLKLSMDTAPSGKLASRWHSCAVVSNSGVLAKHGLGSDIDAADLVFRFNDAPTKGYAKSVGSKESIRFINGALANLCVDDNRIAAAALGSKGGLTYVVVPMASAPNLRLLHQRFPSIDWFQLDHSMSKSFNAAMEDVYWRDRQVFDASQGFTPATSGALGMIVALSICDEVRAYGMASSWRSKSRTTNYHYYNTTQATNYHRGFKLEKDLWRRLATNPPEDIDKRDVAIIPGFSHASCH